MEQVKEQKLMQIIAELREELEEAKIFKQKCCEKRGNDEKNICYFGRKSTT